MPNKLRARPARIAVVRQHKTHDSEYPREQMPHATISTRLREVWQAHFDGEYGGTSAGVELGMQLILYLTGNPHVSAERIASLLSRTYPSVAQELAANVHALAEALGDNPDVRGE